MGEKVRSHRKVSVGIKPVVEAVERRVLMAAVSAVSPLNGGQSVAVGSNLTVSFDVATA